MTREQLYKIFKDNGVKYDKDVERESTEGFVNDECAAYAEELYADLTAITRYGMQEGFSRCEDEIRDITKLIASLIAGTSRKQINLAKTREKHQQIKKEATYLRREINMSMLDELMKNLNACISASNAIAEIRKDNQSLCDNLEKSRDILKQIKEKLENAADVTSNSAAEYQAEIFNGLLDWREEVSHCHCYSDTVENLEKLVETADKWQKLTKAATRLNKAKADKDYYVYEHGDQKWDDLDQIISAARFAERTGGLRSDLNAYRNQTKSQYNVEGLREELTKLQTDFFEQRDRINGRLNEIKKESDAVLFSYQNGETDAVSAESRLSILDDEKADLEDELADAQTYFNDDSRDLSLKISDAQSGSRVRDRAAKRFEDFIKQVEAYRENDPAMFVTLCERLDFNKMYDTLTGRMSEKEADDVYVQMEVVIGEVGADLKRQRDNLRVLDRINDRQRGKRQQDERVLREKEEERRRKLQGRTEGGVRRSSSENAEEEAKRKLESRLAGRLGVAAKVTPNEGESNSVGATGLHNEDK